MNCLCMLKWAKRSGSTVNLHFGTLICYDCEVYHYQLGVRTGLW